MKRKSKLNYKEVFFLVGFLISLSGIAQKEKKDRYLNGIVKKIGFRGKQAVFTEGSLDAMKEMLLYINNNERYYLLECHTSSDGRNEENQELTDKIAGMIERILINLGLDSSRFTVIGKGELFPCCFSPTRAGRYKNRRVEIKEISEEELLKLKNSK